MARAHLNTRQIKEIRQARLSGYTWLQIASVFGVSISTAQRHGDPAHYERMEKQAKARWQRTKQEQSHDNHC